MPKKPVELMRVPLNVFVTRSTKESITGIQNDTREAVEFLEDAERST
jgi:hypothetical protein